MEIEKQKLVKDLMKAIAGDVPSSEVIRLATQAKIDLSAVWSEYQQAINMVDTLVKTYAPQKDWAVGWWSPEVTAKQLSPPPAPVLAQIPDRKEKVLAMAEELKTNGEKIITVSTIMERLRAQGDQRTATKMAISVGNILAWSKKWKKVSPGKYEAIEKEQTGEASKGG
jgi:hypothetical protein